MANATRGGGNNNSNDLIQSLDRVLRSRDDNNNKTDALADSIAKKLREDRSLTTGEIKNAFIDISEKMLSKSERQLRDLQKGLTNSWADYYVAQEKGDKQAEREAAKQIRKQENQEFWIKFGEQVKPSFSKLISAVGNLANNVSKKFDQWLGTYNQYIAGINTRLQGSDKNWNKISGTIDRAIGVSPLVKQTAVYENLSKLVSEGINYNVEQRAFLSTVSDRIATTFDAANGTLLQLIRIQQHLKIHLIYQMDLIMYLQHY